MEAGGIEPPTQPCKGRVFPLAPRPRGVVSVPAAGWETQERPVARMHGTGRSHGVLSPARRSFPRTGGVSDEVQFGAVRPVLDRPPASLDTWPIEVDGALGDEDDGAADAHPAALVVEAAAQQRRAAHLHALVDVDA